MKNQRNINVLAECAMMIALSVAIFIVSDFIPWPFLYGGGFTLFGQVPIIVLSYRRGLGYGFLGSFSLALFELFMGLGNFAYAKTFSAYLIIALFDYIIAYGMLGFGGFLKNKLKNQTAEMITGGLVICVIRYICHVISGVTVWSGYCPDGQILIIYSLIYNGSYMLIETIITVIGLAAVSNFMKSKHYSVKR